MTPAEDFFKFNPPSRLDFQSIYLVGVRIFSGTTQFGKWLFYQIWYKFSLVAHVIFNYRTNEKNMIINLVFIFVKLFFIIL